ncbi:hypothetical protein [Pelagicoccus sp. SDUM812005]|uniref:hypothetical protein n=1 Tax=Pelagicoccus sp. SDUM812005 TaxID=3041257 RepID=UPI00280D2E61|nr:hypothetical protein [Pelagicoccus sp. SDUM812005]MDQ8181518.1 hypothetical protein [Pelagicoccus sp. SDUM812005]
MKSQAYFLEEYRLIVEVVLDLVSHEMIVALKKRARQAGWIRPGTNFLVCVNHGTVAITQKEFLQYSEWSAQNLPELKGSRIAVIADSPLLSALNIILKKHVSGTRTIEVFTTLRAAADWLAVPKELILEKVPETRIHDLD